MHLCIAGSVRAMPEKEKPPAMPVDIYFATPVEVRFLSLLSVINIDSLYVLYPSSLSYLHFIALFGRAATAPGR